jgi:GTP-binding protein HflX
MISLGVDDDRPTFEVWNKLDVLSPEDAEAMRARAQRAPGVFAISALTGEGIDVFLAAVTETLQGKKHDTVLCLSFAEGKKRAWLFDNDLVSAEHQTDTGFEITVRWTSAQEAQFARL